MLITRMSASLPRQLADLAGAIARSVGSHPLAGSLDGTVLIGTGDPRLVLPADHEPHVIVPLMWPGRPTRLGRAQVKTASAIVLLNPGEVGHLRDAIRGCPMIVTVADGHTAYEPFLRGANPFETMEALAVLDEHPALRRAIASVVRALPQWSINPTAIADAVIEAVVACSAVGPGPHSGASGQD